MAEEFNVITPSGITEGGAEIPADIMAAIQIVADNIQAIIAIADSIDSEGNITVPYVNGNDTLIRVQRATEANWLLFDPVLHSGEFGVTLDKADPYELKLGDDVKKWSELNNILQAGELTQAALDAAVAAAEAAKVAAQLAETNAETAETAAEAAQANSATSAQLSADWAAAPATQDLPGGKKSSEVSAARAEQAAATSRYLPNYPTVLTAGFTYAADRLFKRILMNAASNVDITIPPNIYNSANVDEAWGLIRKIGAGNIRVVAAAGGSDLQIPTLVKAGLAGLRVETAAAVNSSVTVSLSAIPAVVDGKIVVVIEGHPSDSAAKTASCSATIGGAFTERSPPLFDQIREAQYCVYDADLDAYAGGNATVTGVFGTMVDYMGVHVWIIDGHGGPMTTPVKDVNTNTGTTKTITLPSIPATSLVLGFGGMRGPVGAVGVASFGAGQSNTGIGDYSVWPSPNVGATAAFKNGCWGASAGFPSVTGDFNWTINFTTNLNRPAAVAFSYPPKTVIGAGTVDLKLMGGRDTLNVLYGDLELWFAPDGKTVYVKTPSA